MTKVEFYNAVVGIYNKTGQGTPKFIADRLPDPSVLDELIEEGLLKIVTIPFSHFPDDHQICPTKGYCVEEDLREKKQESLSFLRLYKGIDPIVDLGNVHKLTISEALKDKDFVKRYSDWLIKNYDKLEEMEQVETIVSLGDEITDEIKAYIKTRSWYKKNNNIDSCLDQLKSGDRDLDENISLTKKIIKLQEDKLSLYKRKNDKKGIDETLKEISNSNKELDEYTRAGKMRPKIKIFLEKQDKMTLIQNLIN